MPRPLTIKQERFCHAYIETDGNASEAYRRAYNAGKMSAAAIWVAASRLMDNANVALRIKELRAGASKRLEISIDWALGNLRELSGDTYAPTVRVTATKALLEYLTDAGEQRGDETGPSMEDLEAADRRLRLVREEGSA